ncbi:cholesterol 7-desaturase nvd [Synchiropus splendidus]|uniref:cholesterol 7-desaturase nvd n=1 Tax=Synchiropus splendidus TaxID=270530 RepID=UPI00237D34F4|nr:cholesterol 7-desaturase nvd [Synchiropus splendidus]
MLAVVTIVLVGLGLAVTRGSGALEVSLRQAWRETGQLGAAAPLFVCIVTFGTLYLLLGLYRLLFSPLKVLKGPEEVGYIPAEGRTRAQAYNDVRRRRKVGELPPIYPNGWYRLLDSHMLERGQVQTLSVFGFQLVVFRGNDGKAHVLDAYCPHLGANLGVGGRVVGDCIECPFHGWQFQGNSGKCVKIPYTEKVPEFAKVKHWHSCEVNSLILVWYHCDDIDPEWTVPELGEITSGEWAYRGRTEHFVNCHIQEIPENAADLAHLAHLHIPGMASGSDLRYTNSKAWAFMKHNWKAQWEPEQEPNKHCSQMLVKHALYLFGVHFSLLDVHVVARQIGPGLVFLTFNHSFLGRGVIMHCVTPVEPLVQCVSHTIFYQANIPTAIPKFILMSERIQFERDVMIWNSKKYISKPLLVKEDQTIQKHRRWFSQFYSENSPQFQYQRDTLEF